MAEPQPGPYSWSLDGEEFASLDQTIITGLPGPRQPMMVELF